MRRNSEAFGLIAFMVLGFSVSLIDSGAVVLNSGNVDKVLAENEFVFINFYADWCRFSNMLSPVWDEFAEKAEAEFGPNKNFVIGKIDCDKESSLGTRFHITKYPTLKYVRNGVLAKREYRGQRSAEAFVNFIRDQTKDAMQEFTVLKDVDELDSKKRHLIGYFQKKDSKEYENYRRTAANLKDDCEFHAGFGEVVDKMHPPGQSIVAFRTNKARSNEDDEVFRGNLHSYDEFSIWAADKCTPLVREITFENAEELTEEGLPFLILLHAPEDNESIKRFTEIVQRDLMEDKQNVNFLIADGVKFAHPLHHLGKAKSDLPLIAIDSFRHMYLFPKYEDMEIPGKLKQFLQDLYSGKLHREFHYGPDKDTSSDDPSAAQQQNEVNTGNHDRVKRDQPKSPPPSQFQHLGPSKNRYTLLHDEF
ncbi:endoplasmic reticulum resident protein 44-like [Tigriopus californicus]|uniref:endoplasmic reticulum resident protein 44-like n=1 Tax=Tigriopus californicus TaxID=6832 RepID=UPI0027DAAF9C|nr:endoplasmic reticulum resident protein 44-like [Tigriopus californicus]|eukprot:TCALIF_08882-PA protein Name:"Similar to ERP44 Endoplasmic reticulum resident protein 44 (Homo sapiens)" AED:0.09 eAED:0.09 QI:683/1/1/1/0.87/0.77/9/726/419